MKQLFLCHVFKISSFGQLKVDEIYLHKIQKSIVYCVIGECDYAYDEVRNNLIAKQIYVINTSMLHQNCTVSTVFYFLEHKRYLCCNYDQSSLIVLTSFRSMKIQKTNISIYSSCKQYQLTQLQTILLFLILWSNDHTNSMVRHIHGFSKLSNFKD